MTKSKKAKKIPPSRYRYEEKNPTVSARLPKEIRDRLRTNLAKQGRSLADALIAITNDLDIKGKSYDEAKREGYEQAKKHYRKTKKAAGQLMSDAGWGHTECHKRRRQR